jgi:hypothetical protein
MVRELHAIELAPMSIWGHLRCSDLRKPTADALFRRGLIRLCDGSDTKLELTPAGREALAEAERESGAP